MDDNTITLRTELRKSPKVIAVARYLSHSRHVFVTMISPEHREKLDFLKNSVTTVTERVTSASRIVTLDFVTRVTVCALAELWGSLKKVMPASCILPYMTLDDIDNIVDIPDFGKALESVGWVVQNKEKGLFFPNFFEHNPLEEEPKGPKSSAQRSREYRNRKKAENFVTICDETSRNSVTRDFSEGEGDTSFKININTPSPSTINPSYLKRETNGMNGEGEEIKLKLIQLGLTSNVAHNCIVNAHDSGARPSWVRAVIAHYERVNQETPGTYGPGALKEQIENYVPGLQPDEGWPNLHPNDNKPISDPELDRKYGSQVTPLSMSDDEKATRLNHRDELIEAHRSDLVALADSEIETVIDKGGFVMKALYNKRKREGRHREDPQILEFIIHNLLVDKEVM